MDNRRMDRWKDNRRMDRWMMEGRKWNRNEGERKASSSDGRLQLLLLPRFWAMSQVLSFPVLPLNHKTLNLLRDSYGTLTLPLVLQKRKLSPREKVRPSHSTRIVWTAEPKLHSGPGPREDSAPHQSLAMTLLNDLGVTISPSNTQPTWWKEGKMVQRQGWGGIFWQNLRDTERQPDEKLR